MEDPGHRLKAGLCGEESGWMGRLEWLRKGRGEGVHSVDKWQPLAF